jgi:L-threonylcarbamoyladenylate synthase
MPIKSNNDSLNDQIALGAKIIKEGGLVAFPTETVYGLGANALDPYAVAKIFQVKERPSFDPLIVHIATLDQLNTLASNVDDAVLLLAEKFWPGPLTMVLPKTGLVPDIVTSGLNTVGIRMPDNPIALELIKQSGCPIAAPSANKFGRISPTKASHVRKQLHGVDCVIDGGSTTVGIESTIVLIEKNRCTLLRAGKITLDEIKSVLPGDIEFCVHNSDEAIAPGQLKSHYSPLKALYLLEGEADGLPGYSGLIAHQNNHPLANVALKTIVTSAGNNQIEIAANLFSALHTMEDDPEIKQIYISPVEEKGLGIALMDRIRKAAYRHKA